MLINEHSYLAAKKYGFNRRCSLSGFTEVSSFRFIILVMYNTHGYNYSVIISKKVVAKETKMALTKLFNN